jgi:hypothetical protein
MLLFSAFPVMAMKLLLIAATVAIAALADDAEDVRAVLRRFNEAARKLETDALEAILLANADYRDGTRVLRGSDALVSMFADRKPWSERTPPTFQDESIRIVGTSAAFVDAQLIWYGSTLGKSTTAVVLLLEKQAGAWKIASIRVASCGIPPAIE